MNPRASGGSGYNDPEKMKAAMELAQSFKKGGSKEDTYSRKGRSRSREPRDSYHEYRPSSRASSRPPSRGYSRPNPTSMTYSNIPPPSQRNYTNTLVADTSQMGSGPILGSKVLEFLRRQDQPEKLTTISESQKSHQASEVSEAPEPAKVVKAASTFQTSSATKTENVVPPDVRKTEPSVNTPVSSIAIGKKGEENHGNVDSFITPPASQKSHKSPGLLGASISNASDESSSQKEPKITAKANILDTFFSFMQQDQTKDIQGTLSALTSQPSFVKQGTNAQEKVKGFPGDTTRQVANKTAKPKNRENTKIASPEVYTEGKRNVLDQDQDQPRHLRLRPDAPEFTSEQQLEPPCSINISGKTLPTGKSTLSPEATAWIPNQQQTAQQSLLQSDDALVQTGPAYGHVVSVTPVHIADGLIVPGPTTGQLWLQTPVTVTQNVKASSSKNPAMVDAINSSEYSRPQDLAPHDKLEPKPQKPIVGLMGSKWAPKK